MTAKTFTGKNVDEATENALRALDANLEDVEIKVVSPGRSGILGFGGEPAEIEVRLLNESARTARGGDDDEEDAPAPRRARQPRRATSRRTSRTRDAEQEDAEENVTGRSSGPKAAPTIIPMNDGDDDEDEESDGQGPAVASGEEDDEDRDDRRRGRRRGRRGGRGRRRNGTDGEDGEETVAVADSESGDEDEDYASFDDEDEDDDRRRDDGPPAERDAEAEQLVGELLDYFLGAMGVVAETFVRDETDNGSLVFEIEGEDAGLLIGRRGETLQALQFLTRLIVNRQLGRKAYMMIDIEGYRERRFEMLRRLARRTAGRVATSGRPAALDPMSPGERRIVHLSLSRHPRVRTESEGEGSRRHVVIRPKR